ncbi:hypothetical protein AWJ20_1251 [Sugiyamaella lignohabitans]|uniref:Ubiquitin-like domain-containing protein n=1 Tax=Sugiyamaella lignohabitans TaxID=796027 RepID=A0A167DJ33_9ASCO|nr:uncharacterized protein AWJ20_1251 [Sugiyamaella lignohabitans]ANB12973.1 hypothetical protein AWJ20_1251 [Sugiyamaella lignohabitans]
MSTEHPVQSVDSAEDITTPATGTSGLELPSEKSPLDSDTTATLHAPTDASAENTEHERESTGNLASQDTTNQTTTTDQYSSIQEEIASKTVKQPEAPALSLELTLLLISGLRVKIKIDDNYMQTHSIPITAPESMTVGSLKSSLFSSWQDEWGSAPTTTGLIRLIHLGKILEDQQTLEECSLTSSKSHNVVHLSVKPESFEMEAPTKVKSRSGFRGGRSGDQREGQSRGSSSCCIIL